MKERDEILNRKKSSSVEAIPPEELQKLDAIIDKYEGRAGYLVPALKEAQDIFGFLPSEVQHTLANGLNIPASQVYGVVTFYSSFTVEPRGKYTIRLCLGTTCYVKGAKEIYDCIVKDVGIDVGETSTDGRFTFEAVRCLGGCGVAPVMMVGRDTHGNVDPAQVIKILDGYH